MITARRAEALGFQRKPSWYPSTEMVDFSQDLVAATTGINRHLVNIVPLTNPGIVIKSPDPYESDTPGGKLTAATASRGNATGRNPMSLLIGAQVVHMTVAGAVFQPAATVSILLRLVSVGSSAVGPTTIGTVNVTTDANPVAVMTLVPPADRAFGLEGVANVLAIPIYNGDTLFAEITNTNAGALTPSTTAPSLLGLWVNWA